MPSSPLDLVVVHLRKLAAPAEDPTDAQLLSGFLAGDDKTAFESLVRRHGRLVRMVCHQVLKCEHDVEDAFQATFLLLAKKAKSIRKLNSVSSWLHGAAYRIALNARKLASRRCTREREHVRLPEPTPDKQAALHELQGIIAEEVDRLPERFKIVFVLCCLEGKAKEEAARELGWKTGTVSGRLARARQRLRVRLSHRGVNLSIALCIISTFEDSIVGGASALEIATLSRVATILAAGKTPGIGAISSRVTSLLFAAARPRLAVQAGVLSASLTLVMIFALSSWANLPRQIEALLDLRLPNTSPALELGDPDAQLQLSASGRVINDRGLPIEGATAYLLEMAFFRDLEERNKPNYTDVLAQTKTNAEGLFQFKNITTVPLKKDLSANSYKYPWRVVILAKGYGAVWHQFESPLESNLSFRMAPEFPLHGRLLDANKKPAAGVTVKVQQLTDQVDRVQRARVAPYDSILLQDSHLPFKTTTGPIGEFVLHGLPREHSVDLVVDDSRFARRWLACASIPNESIAAINRPVNGQPSPVEGFDAKLLPDNFTAVLLPRGKITGVIICGDTGKPAVGVRVTLGMTEAVTDKDGRYVFDGFEPRTYPLYVHASQNLDYQDKSGQVAVSSETLDGRTDFILEHGAIMTGQLRAKDTKQPVAAGYVDIWLESEEPTPVGTTRMLGTARTRPDGTYRMVVRPGKGKVTPAGWLSGFVPRYLSDEDKPGESARIEIKFGETLSGIDVFLNRGTTVTGKVFNTRGEPVPGARFIGVARQQSSEPDGSFFLSGLSAFHSSQLLVLEPQRHLGAVIEVAATSNSKPVKLDVKLQSTQSGTGRIVDIDNQPIAGARVEIFASVRQNLSDKMYSLHPVKWTAASFTDSEGVYSFANLIPGGSYRIIANKSGYASGEKHMRVEAGKSPELGNLSLLISDRALNGVVVSGSGQPLEGIEVWILAKNPGLAGGPQVMTTGKDGRFSFDHLFAGEYRLRATKWQQTGEVDKQGKPTSLSLASTEEQVQAGTIKRIVLNVPTK